MEKVLITGGSEGIGYAFAKLYIRRGYDVVLVARNEEKLKHACEQLKQMSGGSVEMFVCNLSDMHAVHGLIEQMHGKNISVLINNAGIGYQKAALDISDKEDEDLICLNVQASAALTKAFAKEMIDNGHGTIINVASTGAFQPGPYIASYYASKSFVLSYTRALKEELRDTGIRIYCLCPGPVDTAFYAKSGGHMSRYHMSADACVQYTYDHMKKRTVIVPGVLNRLLMIVPSGIKMKWLAAEKKKEH